MAREARTTYFPGLIERGSPVLFRGHDKWCASCLSAFLLVLCFYGLIMYMLIQIFDTADAKKQYPELYTSWREDPANFHVAGIYPIRKLWGTAREAWKEILLTPVSDLQTFLSMILISDMLRWCTLYPFS